jgi:uncharacterized protein YegJ (DUF2314 family)
MWLRVLSLDGEAIRGVIDNDPANVTSVKRGSEVYVSRQQVADWLYTDGRDIKGNFSRKALHG